MSPWSGSAIDAKCDTQSAISNYSRKHLAASADNRVPASINHSDSRERKWSKGDVDSKVQLRVPEKVVFGGFFSISLSALQQKKASRSFNAYEF
jgi:hypothetical protein